VEKKCPLRKKSKIITVFQVSGYLSFLKKIVTRGKTFLIEKNFEFFLESLFIKNFF